MTFDPDWTVHPGELVREELLAQGLLRIGHRGEITHGYRVAARLLRLTTEELQALIECDPKARITPAVAAGLASFSASARMWLRLQELYDDGIAKGKTVS